MSSFESVSEKENKCLYSNNKTWTLTESICENIIKWLLLELSTNLRIEHRLVNNSRFINQKVSPLVESIKVHKGSFDAGIKSLAKSVSSAFELGKMLNTLYELYEITDDPIDSYEIVNKINDLEDKFFDLFVELTGIYELKGLYSESMKTIKEHMFELIYI